ncbi:MAG TPA: zinc metallopeptidase [Candidatus Nitrosotenuis sp.]|jgi:Zn-dependent membrane protease YugP|nr:zinc metallopeptidase [Candidatus Nitrosotenuis sp.]
MLGWWDPHYLFLVLLPTLALSLAAQWLVQSTFRRYAMVPVASGLSGGEAAYELARRSGLPVRIERYHGFLSDHYDPGSDTLRLSPDVYEGRSVASLGVAAHELGHALQKAQGYFPMYLRAGLVPLANVGYNLAWPLIVLGLFLRAEPLQVLGVAVFGAAVLFTLVTLPVEFDASARALKLLAGQGLISGSEVEGVRKVLGAAALTYVAAAITAVLQLLYYIGLARSDD